MTRRRAGTIPRSSSTRCSARATGCWRSARSPRRRPRSTGGVSGISRAVPEESRHLVVDLIDQFDRIAALAGEEKDYLQGVIEFYRTRTDTKMTIAAERLAVIAVVTLPITALASVLGMNMIVNQHTTPIPLAVGAGHHARDVGGAPVVGEAAGLVVTSGHEPLQQARAIGQAPVDVVPTTVTVSCSAGSWKLRNETPAS